MSLIDSSNTETFNFWVFYSVKSLLIINFAKITVLCICQTCQIKIGNYHQRQVNKRGMIPIRREWL